MRHLSVDPLSLDDAVLAAEATALERGGGETQVGFAVAGEVDRRDSVPHALGREVAERAEPFEQGIRAAEDLVHRPDRVVARGLVAEILVLFGPGDDLSVEPRHPFHELEVVLV